MDYIPLLVLALCACGHAEEAASGASAERRRDVQHAYARHHDQYEPYAYAAVPLHAPMPLLHFLSPSPLHKYPPVRKSRPRRPDADLHAYASSPADDFAPYEYGSYSPGHQYVASEEEEETQPVVVYARPNKHGGYSYRKRPSRPDFQTTPRPPLEPIVFRIHKYKITRD